MKREYNTIWTLQTLRIVLTLSHLRALHDNLRNYLLARTDFKNCHLCQNISLICSQQALTRAPVTVPTQPTMWLMCEGWPATFFEQWGVSSFTSAQESDYCKCCETGPTVFRPYPRRLVCRCHALSSQLFKDSECWTGQGSSPRPPAQLTRALQSELTRRWLERKLILSKATSKQIRNHDTTKRRCDLNQQHNKQA